MHEREKIIGGKKARSRGAKVHRSFLEVDVLGGWRTQNGEGNVSQGPDFQ